MDEKNWAIVTLTSAKADLKDDIWTFRNRDILYLSDEYRDYLIDRAEKRIKDIDDALEVLTTTK